MADIIKMKYSTEPKHRKYVKDYGFLSFARKFENEYRKKLVDNATKAGIDAAKSACKGVVQKTAEATGDSIGNKIADSTTSADKTKCKEKEDEKNKRNIHTTRKKTANY